MLPRVITSALLLAASCAITLAAPSEAVAGCSFFAGPIGKKTRLYNDASQVIMVRDGTRTTLTLRNQHRGALKEFALILPVPVLLKPDDVRTVNEAIFHRLDHLSAPTLEEFWRQERCVSKTRTGGGRGTSGRGYGGLGLANAAKPTRQAPPRVQIKASFRKREYTFQLLGAKDSSALVSWLRARRYQLPKGAAKVLNSYVQQGMYFLVARVDPRRVPGGARGRRWLSPIQLTYTASAFALPVRLGQLNAAGAQELTVFAITKKSRVEAANYKNVMMPTNLVVDPRVKAQLGAFHDALFRRVAQRHPGALVTEYAAPLDGQLSARELGWLGLRPNGTPSASSLPPVSETFGVIRRDQRAPLAPGLMQSMLRAKIQQCAWLDPDAPLRRDWDRLRLRVHLDPQASRVDVALSRTYTTRRGHTMSRAVLREDAESACIRRGVRKVGQGFMRGMDRDGQKTTFMMRLTVRGEAPLVRATSGWVMTRLHARYTPATMTRDIVLRRAPAVQGGVGVPSGASGVAGGLRSIRATSSGQNGFFTRYVVLHRGGRRCKRSWWSWSGQASGGDDGAGQVWSAVAFRRPGARLSIPLRRAVRTRGDGVWGSTPARP